MEIRTTPRFVTPEDFLNRYGIDLNKRLKDDDNPSNKANCFLLNIEERLMSWIDKTSFRNYNWENLEPYQLEHWCNAILLQAKYVLRNGDLSTDSGYDIDGGVIASREQINSIEIAQPVIDELARGSLMNHIVENRTRYFHW